MKLELTRCDTQVGGSGSGSSSGKRAAVGLTAKSAEHGRGWLAIKKIIWNFLPKKK